MDSYSLEILCGGFIFIIFIVIRYILVFLKPPKIYKYLSTDSQISIFWLPVNGSISYRGYYRQRGGDPLSWNKIPTKNDDSLSFNSINGLYYEIIVQTVGYCGAFRSSDPIIARSRVSAPTNFRVSYQGKYHGRVTLNWTPISTVMGYRIVRRRVAHGQSLHIVWQSRNPHACQFQDLNVIYGVKYQYAIFSIDLAGESVASDFVDVCIRAPPPKSFNAYLSEQNNNYCVVLQWDSVIGTRGYIIQRRKGNLPFQEFKHFNSSAVTRTEDTAFEFGFNYIYVISSIDVIGRSMFTKLAEIFPRVSPPKHFSASYDPKKTFSINLRWTSVPKCLGYRIERIISNSTNNGMLVLNAPDPSTTQFEDRFERYGINYLYTITARDHEGPSDVWTTTTVCPRVSAPTDIRITYNGDRPNDIILQWKEVLGGIGYTIRRSDNRNPEEFIHMDSIFNKNKTEFIDKSFKCGLKYNYTVTSIDSAGLSETSAVISILPRAVPPKNLKLHFDNEKQNGIQLQWEPVLQAAGYVVHRAVIDSKTDHEMEEVAKYITGTNWEDKSFSYNTNYKYSVSSVDLAGVSGSSEIVSIFTKVPDIDNLISVYDETIGNVVSLEWRASSMATSYLVKRKDYECNEESAIILTENTKSITRVHDITFKHGIQYEYTVMAMDSMKHICRLSKIALILRVPVPAKFRVICEDKLPKFILLRWECVPQGLGYIIERSIDNKIDSGFITIMTINNPFKTQIKDLYFNYGITYSYIVRAIDLAGPSAASKLVSVCPRVPPPESPVAVYDDEQEGVILEWNMMMGAVGYILERTAPNYRQDIPMTKELKGYSTTKEIDSSIICGITYRYVLFALDETGKSRGSKPVQICPRARGPRDLRIQYNTRTAYKANLRWNPSPHSKGYLVKRALGENNLHFESVKNIDDNSANEALDIPLIYGIKNHFKVFSIDHAGSSQESNTVSIFPRISAPTNLKITLDDRNEPSIVIQWDAVMNAKGYTVQRATGRKNRQFETIGTLNESCMTTFMESNLIWGVKYTYKVRATDTSGPSFTYAEASIFVRAPSPKIEKVDLQDNDTTPSCMIYWNKIPNVIGYQVKKQNCTEKTSFQKIRTVQHCSTTSFADTSVRWGISFQYTVTSIDKAGHSDCSEPFRVCFRATKPKLFHVKPDSKTNDALTLHWQPNLHCKGYCIYRHCSSSESDSSTSAIIENPLDNEKYLLTLVNDSKTDIFTDRSLKSGIEYVYTITCIDELGKSSNYSSAKGKCALACPDEIGVKPLDQQKMILLSWECVISADGYRIERLVAGKRPITVARIYGSNCTTFVDYTDLLYNEAYRYRMYAFDQKGESLPLTTPDAVTLIPSKEHSDSNAFIDIRFGNLCTEEVDAIAVCPTSEKLMQTILDAAGTTVKDELKMLKTSKLIEPIVVPAGQLSCKKLILIPWQPLKTLEEPLEKSVRRFITKALELASAHVCNTIAFPALGCGAFGCNAATVAKTMTSEIDRQIRSPQCSVKRVSIIVEANKQTIFDTFRVQLRIQTDKNCQRSEEHIPFEWIVVNDDYPLCVSITEDSDEYRSILEDFRELKTKYLFQNFRVERIQNRRLYRQYQVEKEYLEQQLNKDTERRLFHGCPNRKNAIQSIIENGFDRSLAGNHFGTRFGKGVYFSSRILESHKYAKDDEITRERTMFVCLVLLGRSKFGTSNMITCPPGYHSTTDEDSIYVTFRDSQAYVQYVVYYK